MVDANCKRYGISAPTEVPYFLETEPKVVLHTREGFPVFLPGTRLFCNMLIVSRMRKMGVPDTLEFTSTCNDGLL